MKKNVIVIVAAVALVLLAVPTIAFANGMQQAWCPANGTGAFAHHAMRAAGESDAAAAVGTAIATIRGEYVDRSNGGACDSYGADRSACPGYADVDENGICDNCTANKGACPNYVDADNDGVCDAYAAGHRGCGNGCAYVDADGDGVCDSYGTGSGNGNGCANGRGSGYGHGGGHHGCARR